MLFIMLCYVIVHVSSLYVVIVVVVTNVSPISSLPLFLPRPAEKRRWTPTTTTTTWGKPCRPAAAGGDDGRDAFPDAPPLQSVSNLDGGTTSSSCSLSLLVSIFFAVVVLLPKSPSQNQLSATSK